MVAWVLMRTLPARVRRRMNKSTAIRLMAIERRCDEAKGYAALIGGTTTRLRPKLMRHADSGATGVARPSRERSGKRLNEERAERQEKGRRMGVDRHPLGSAIHFDADRREAGAIEGKDEERVDLEGREGHLLRSGGHGRRTARCVLAGKWAGAGVIDGDALPTARLTGFLRHLLKPAAAMTAAARWTRIGLDADGPNSRKWQPSLVPSATPTRHEPADAHARRHEHRQSGQDGEQHSEHDRRSDLPNLCIG